MSTRTLVALLAVVAAAATTGAQTAVIAPTPNLVADGIPPIPASIAADVRRYTESRSANLVDWHPTRRELLISTRFGNSAQIHVVKAPGGARTQLTFGDEPITAARYQPGEGRYFVFRRDTGGDEFGQLYRYDLQDGRITLVTDGGRSQNSVGVWSHGGDRLAYTTTRRNGADRDVHVMDPANPVSDRAVLQVSGGGWTVFDWSPDDKALLVSEEVSVEESHLWLVDAASGQKTALTPAGERAAYGFAQFGRDGRGVYVTTDRGAEFQRLSYLDLSSKTITPLTPDINWDIENFEVSPDGRTVAFVSNEAGVSRLRLLDARSRAARSVAGVPPGVIGSLLWHPAGNEVAFTVASARSASDVYSLTLRNNQVTRWTESELGGLVAADLAEPELVTWASFDGLEISGFYYRPPARFSGRRPVLINIHGGPESQVRPSYIGRSNYFLNEMGVAIIYPNVRGSTGYGKTFVGLDNGMKREDSVRDIGALLDWIARRPELDSSRVMVTGGSYGGYMALAVATHYSDRIRCALDVVGISNYNTFLKNTESYRRDLRRVEYGDERQPEMAAFFERTAPLNNAHKITRPLFVVQGGNDPRVPRTESEQMVARVKKNGTPVWYLMATDEGHGFAKKSNADFQFYASVMFMREFLLGSEGAGRTGAPARQPQ
jgi:dipeptidyl aminopeptidase/acylaminoacyl peptidase